LGSAISGALALALTSLAASAARADPPAPVQAVSGIEAAKLLIQSGDLADAKKVLASLEAANPRDDEVQFLLGLIAVQEKDYPSAIARFRRVLVDQPRAPRVRLELARAFYLAKDYDNAERQFRFARAGDLPEAAKANIDKYLVAIRDQREVSYSLAAAVEPDTDINRGPSLSTVTLYGLPFVLSPQARAASGTGFSGDASLDYSPHLGGGWRLRLGGQADTLDYGQRQFDDSSVGVYAGPRWVGGRWDASLLATGFQRWYGGVFYNQGAGVSLPVSYSITPKLGLSASVSALSTSYRAPEGQNGLATSGAIGLIAVLDTASQASATVSVTRQAAQVSAYAYTARQLELRYTRDLPAGFTVSIAPAYVTLDYDSALAAFGEARHDRQWRTQITLLNRRIDIAGFTPKLSYTHTDNASDLAFFSYRRDQGEIGVTRAF
jgi:tetratricopeptide (TPR) repeat protein